MSFRGILVIAIAVCILRPAISWSATGEAARHVREGIRKHRAGDYEAAEKAFAQADESSPQDPRIAFNRACSLAAQGKGDEAVELFQKASLARDEQLVASSRYNLGCLKAAQGKALFGAQPQEATGETREQGLALLIQAVAHFRDCLRVSPAHQRARHNLELLRLWIKNMQDVWAQRDRQRRRDETDLLQFLEMLTSEQRVLRGTDRVLAKEDLPLGPGGAISSPRRRQAIAETERQQRELAEEIEPLRQKIDQALQPPPAAATGNQPPPSSTPDPNLDRAREALIQLALRAESTMFRAADDLAVRELDKAIEAQTEALQALDDVFRAVAPFEALLQKATAVQEQLVERSTQLAEADQADDASPAVESEQLVEDQTLVALWSEALTAKAQHGLSQLASRAQLAGPPDDEDTSANQPSAAQSAADPTAVYDKAVELGPKISDLAREAVGHLDQESWHQALPKQEEALQLLREIVEQQQKQDQQQEQDQEQDQNKDQQDGSDQQQDQNKDQQDGSDQQQQQQESSKEKKQQRQQRLSREQAESLLRKVRQREREHRERQRELQGYLRAAAGVDKDW